MSWEEKLFFKLYDNLLFNVLDDQISYDLYYELYHELYVGYLYFDVNIGPDGKIREFSDMLDRELEREIDNILM